MQFAVYCLDKPDHAQVRADNRNAHIEHLNRHADRLILAGPLLSDDEQGMLGSLLVLDVADRAALDRFLAEDPYAKASLFQSVAVKPFRKTFPK
jgi:uncharacterized protein YciI